MQPGQASLSSLTSCLWRPLSLDSVMLIWWASFQCQQKSIPSSGRSQQSLGNELWKELCHRQALWGNRGTLFPSSHGVTRLFCAMLIFCFVLGAGCHCQHSESLGGVCCTFWEICMEPGQMSVCESESFSGIRDCSLDSLAVPQKLKGIYLEGWCLGAYLQSYDITGWMWRVVNDELLSLTAGRSQTTHCISFTSISFTHLPKVSTLTFPSESRGTDLF